MLSYLVKKVLNFFLMFGALGCRFAFSSGTVDIHVFGFASQTFFHENHISQTRTLVYARTLKLLLHRT